MDKYEQSKAARRARMRQLRADQPKRKQGAPRKPDTPERIAWREQKRRRRELLRLM